MLKLRATPAGDNVGKWTILQVVGHLADCDQFLADRIKRTIAYGAAGQRPLLVGVDENKYMAAFDYNARDLGEELALLHATRNQVARLLRPLPNDAWNRKGVHTESEIATALDIDPALAEKTLRALSKLGIASQRWQDYRKNVWEFPDYIHLPISETLDRAKRNGGHISLSDLVAAGHSIETATQTLDTLSEKGLAQQDPAATSRAVILNTQ